MLCGDGGACSGRGTFGLSHQDVLACSHMLFQHGQPILDSLNCFGLSFKNGTMLLFKLE